MKTQTYSQYFAEKGITSTSANHVANMAKEMAQQWTIQLESLSFINETMTLLESGNKVETQKGITLEELKKIPSIIEKIQSAHALIAWLREAIKEKETSIKLLNSYTLEQYCIDNNLAIPEKPKEPEYLTAETYMRENWSIGELNKMWQLEAEVSTLGKLIHPSGKLSDARKAFQKIKSSPNKVQGNGRDTIITTYSSSINSEDIENLFFNLQKKHRALQAELNGIKHSVEETIRIINEQSQNEYVDALSAYNEAMIALRQKIIIYKKKVLKEISDKKIIIPNNLSSIFDEVSKLGK